MSDLSEHNAASELANEKIARLYWQCRRGMLELDVLLQSFFPGGYQQLSNGEQRCFENLLAESDELLLEYLMGRTIPMDSKVANVINKIRAYPNS